MKPLILISVLNFCVCYAQSSSELTFLNAMRNGAQFDVRIRVVDDIGIPIAGVKCEGWMYIDNHVKNGYPHSAITGSNGIVRVSGKCGRWVSVFLTKKDYYMSQEEISFQKLDTSSLIGNGKWVPYGELKTIVLKKIRKPVHLVQSVTSRIKNPDTCEWQGYDLELRDWLPPYGNGRHSDFLVRINIDAVAPRDFKAFMEISFTNNPFAGAYLLKKDPCSEMKSIYRADTNAEYKTSFEYLHEEHPIIHREPIVYVQGVNKTDTRLDKDSYLVFRTRTKIDRDGNLESAHYGKIYGPWEIFRAMHAYGVYFNPKENDTNLEDIETADHSRMLQRQREEDEQSQKKKRKSLWPF